MGTGGGEMPVVLVHGYFQNRVDFLYLASDSGSAAPGPSTPATSSGRSRSNAPPTTCARSSPGSSPRPAPRRSTCSPTPPAACSRSTSSANSPSSSVARCSSRSPAEACRGAARYSARRVRSCGETSRVPRGSNDRCRRHAGALDLLGARQRGPSRIDLGDLGHRCRQLRDRGPRPSRGAVRPQVADEACRFLLAEELARAGLSCRVARASVAGRLGEATTRRPAATRRSGRGRARASAGRRRDRGWGRRRWRAP